MSRREAVNRVAKALVAAERRKLHRLVKRLGIQPEIDATCERLGFKKKDSDWIAWMLVGQMLAQDQPEFTGAPQAPGRPRKFLTESIDVQRALVIKDLISREKQQNSKPHATIDWIEALVDSNHPLFSNAESTENIQALQNSVSRGRSELKKLRLPNREVEKNNQK
jgi:hypothetical protein